MKDVSVKNFLAASGESLYDDLRFPFTSTKRGSLDKPDFDFTNIGLLFPRNNATEAIYIVAQLPHTYKEGTDIHPHIHWQQMNSSSVVWKMSYKWFNSGETAPAAFTTITSGAGVFSYTSGNISQLSSFGGIGGQGKEISSLLLITVFREDNIDAGAGGGDALAFEFDIHILNDSTGSRYEFVKE